MGLLTWIGTGAAAGAAVLGIAYKIHFWRLDELQRLFGILKDARDAGVDDADMKALRDRAVSRSRGFTKSSTKRRKLLSPDGFIGAALLVLLMMTTGGSLGALLMFAASPNLHNSIWKPIATMIGSVILIGVVLRLFGSDSTDASPAAGSSGPAA